MRSGLLALVLTAVSVPVLMPDAAAAPSGLPAPVADPVAVQRLAPFLAALRALEEPAHQGIVRIGWWGDSAIVSDGYTGQLRKRLQARFGDAGPGFILPATTFNGYLRKGVRLKRHDWETDNIIQGALKSGRYGYGGIQSSSWGGASSTFESQGAPFDRVGVFHRAFPKAGDLQIFADQAGSATATHPAAQDVAADAVWWWEAPPGGVKKVRVRSGGRGMSVVYGIALERGQRGVVLDTLGVLGMRARRWLKADRAHLRGQIAARNPQLLALAFGGNERVDPGLSEEGHAKELGEVVAMMKAGAPDAACLIVGPLPHGERHRGGVRLDPRLHTINAAQSAAADAQGCAFFNAIAATGGDESVAIFRKHKLIGGDLAHLNPAGHVVVGDLLADWLVAQLASGVR